MKTFVIISLLILLFKDTISQTLHIGDPAPPISFLQWLKGDSVSEFRKNHLYLIEFTGSQCVPCRVVAPHLTEIAQKFKDQLTVIGICIGENNNDVAGSIGYVSRVREFVKKMGNRMDYNVAVDNPNRTMQKTWMEAFYGTSPGIPDAFLVDGQGKIAWVGHPNMVETPLKQLIDFGAVSTTRSEIMEDSGNSRLDRAKSSKNIEEVFALLDTMIQEKPSQRGWLSFQKFHFLLSIQHEQEAYRYGWKLIKNELRNEPECLLYLSRSIAEFFQNTLKSPDWKLVISSAKRGASLSTDLVLKSRLIELLAKAYYETKDYINAVKYSYKALGILKEVYKYDLENIEVKDVESDLRIYKNTLTKSEIEK